MVRAQAKVYAVGILETVPRAQNQASFAALLSGLRELGYVGAKPPYRLPRSSSRATRSPVSEVSTTRPRHSLVKSSTSDKRRGDRLHPHDTLF